MTSTEARAQLDTAQRTCMRAHCRDAQDACGHTARNFLLYNDGHVSSRFERALCAPIMLESAASLTSATCLAPCAHRSCRRQMHLAQIGKIHSVQRMGMFCQLVRTVVVVTKLDVAADAARTLWQRALGLRQARHGLALA